MKIYFLTYAHEQGIQKDTGGIRKVQELAKAFTRADHKAVVFLPKDEFEFERGRVLYKPYGVINITGLRPVCAYLSQFIKPLWLYLCTKDMKPDVIYFRTAPSVLPAFLSWLTRAKFVIEINGDVLGEERGKVASLWRDASHYLRTKLIIVAERINCNAAGAVIALTEGIKEIIVNRYGISPEKIFVINSGTNIDHCRPMSVEQCRKTLGLNGNRHYINFIGVLYKHQGIDTLINAAPSVLEQYPDVIFLIGGGGPMLKLWFQKAEDMGLEKIFRFLGVIPFKKLPLFLNTADICVAPFTGNRGEASPLKLFDYMACGKPVVCSGIPSLRSLVNECKGIISVPPDDSQALASALIGLLNDDSKRESMGGEGRKYIEEHHSWDVIAHKIIDAIK